MKTIRTFQRITNDDFGLICSEMPTMTQQHMRDDCDINIIMRNYVKTGRLDHLNRSVAMYMDAPPQIDYREALEQVQYADDLFMELPASLRESFQNDPANYLTWLSNSGSIEERNKFLQPHGLKWNILDGARTPLDVSVPTDTDVSVSPPEKKNEEKKS